MRRASNRTVLFDAAGTLFDVRGSVGEAYARAARRHGLEVDGAELDREFARVFRTQRPLACAGLRGAALDAAERAWWRRVVGALFRERLDAAVFARCFEDLYAYFGRADAWRLFDDVVPELERLRFAGYRLAVVSNFDSRLDGVLGGLGIVGHFEAVIVSSRAGAAKPDPAIFRRALALLGAAPATAWHVGDAPAEDVAGARAAGMRAILVDRRDRNAACRARRVVSLGGLSRWIR
jgi:putative hydrolase of the HAD superfamily